MKAKEYIIQKLVELGKKYRWMKYPMLAVVSLISLIFLALEKCMERPRRAVIALVCLVLIISQSWYLISVANDPDYPETGNTDGTGNIVGVVEEGVTSDSEFTDTPSAVDEPNGEEKQKVFYLSFVENETEQFATKLPKSGDVYIDSDGNYTMNDGPIDIFALTPQSSYEDFFVFGGWYQGDVKVESAADLKNVKPGNRNEVILLARWDRIAYKLTYSPQGATSTTALPPVRIDDTVNTYEILKTQEQSGYTKTGYYFEGWKWKTERSNTSGTLLSGAEVSYDDFEGIYKDDIILTPDWQKNPYTIVFENGHEDAVGDSFTIPAKYDEDVDMPDCPFTREGYVFVGWRKQDATPVDEFGNAPLDQLVQPGAPSVKNLTDKYEGTYTFYAQWAYLSGELSKKNVTYQYGDDVSESIGVYYMGKTGTGNFSIKVLGVSGATVDGGAFSIDLTSDDEATRIKKFQEFTKITGLTLGSGFEGESFLIKGTVETVTTEPIVVRLLVEDKINLDEDPFELTLTINLVKRKLTITGISNPSKTYDGTDEIGIGTIEFEGERKGAKITLNNGSQVGHFQGEDAKDVGDGKDILIEGIFIKDATDASGKDIGIYYDVPTKVTIHNGSITPKTVRVTPIPVYANGKDYILTGQKPTFTVELNENDIPTAVVGVDENIIINAITMDQGNFTSTYGADYYQSGTHDVYIDTERVSLRNYTLDVKRGTLLVRQEEVGVYGYRYLIEGSKSNDANKWWYQEEPKVVANPSESSIYDRVYVFLNESGRKYTYDAASFQQKAPVSEELAKDESVYIQLGDSQTGAVTAPQRIDMFVDITAPVIDENNIDVSTVNSGTLSKLGNMLSFGNFFKEEILLTIPVSDNLSGLATLTYYKDEAYFESGNVALITNGKATIKLPLNFKGHLTLVAMDNAGNIGNALVIGVEKSNYWVIENTAPVVVVTAVDDTGNTAYSNDGLYYKSVTVTATAVDPDAGVASLKWIVTKDGVDYPIPEERVGDKLEYTCEFTHEFTEGGSYTVSVVACDNAGNESLPTEVRRFNVDGVGPTIHITPENYDDDWATEKTITFTITDTGSGIRSWELVGPNNLSYPWTKVEGTENTYTFTVTKKGTYTIRANDFAGNSNERELTFTRVSNEVPDTPVLMTDVEPSQNGWFTTKPTITVSKQRTTPDGTEVTTYYRMWKDGEAEPQKSDVVGDSFQLPGEGIYNIRVWAESESGMLSAEQPVYQIGYDDKKPVIHDVQVTGKGTINQVTFRVTEETSGLADLEVIYDYNDAYNQRLVFKEISKGLYSANFTAAMTGSYQIKATDVAGNVSYADAFRPMNVIVTNVSGNSENGITIMGQVIAGSFTIANVEVKYGSFGMGYGYNAEELIPVTDKDGNKAITARLTNVADNTTYQFRIIATATTGEVCEYTGTFKTGVLGKSGANVVGTVVDDTSYMRRAAVSNISVMLYDSEDNIIQSINDLGSGDYFMFTEVPDGIYTIRATNGNSSVTQSVIIENGLVVAPEGQLKLVLRGGQRTDIEYEEGNSLHFVVDGLTDLFDDSTNFGDKEREIIEQGGIIEFCMTIDELSESEVPASDRALIAQSLGRQERVLMYVDFSIWKRASFAYGLLWEEQVTAIAGGKSIQIVIPLVSDWVGLKNLSVIRVHGNSVDRLPDLDSNPNTYTISSTLFSTYALVYTDETISTEDPDNSGNNGNGSQDSNNGGNGGASGSTSDISKVPNNNNNLTSNGSGSTPRTGDEAPIVWVSILGLAAGILGSLQLKRRK